MQRLCCAICSWFCTADKHILRLCAPTCLKEQMLLENKTKQKTPLEMFGILQHVVRLQAFKCCLGSSATDYSVRDA